MRDEPDLWEENVLYLRAFSELTTTRTMGFGAIGYIGIDSVVTWGLVNGVTDLAMLWRMVRAADVVYVEWVTEKHQRDRDQRIH